MRLPRTLLVVTFLIACAALCFAADKRPTESNATVSVGIIQAPKTVDSVRCPRCLFRRMRGRKRRRPFLGRRRIPPIVFATTFIASLLLKMTTLA